MSLMVVATTLRASPLSEAVVKASPLDQVVQQYPAMMSKGIRDGLKQLGKVDPFIADTVANIVGSTINGARIRAQIVRDLDAGLSDQQLENVQKWYTTPLGQKVVQAEVDASSPVAWQRIETAAGALKKQYQGSRRAQLFERFNTASRATESTVDTAIAVQLGMASALAALNGGTGAGFEQLRQQVEHQRSAIRTLVQEQVYGAYLYTYEALSTAELEQYIEFLESAYGADFSRVVTGSIQSAVLQPIETLSGQLMKLFSPG
ncbi:hypothetical protein BG841_01935 [Marinobacter sp. X15-166B]|nr:hypothetical protein BG841_01935 [Marinobacter sp. X15-166B]